MNNWIVVEIKWNGDKRALEGEYKTFSAACDVQERMENVCPENSYLVYRMDEYIQECEEGV